MTTRVQIQGEAVSYFESVNNIEFSTHEAILPPAFGK